MKSLFLWASMARPFLQVSPNLKALCPLIIYNILCTPSNTPSKPPYKAHLGHANHERGNANKDAHVYVNWCKQTKQPMALNLLSLVSKYMFFIDSKQLFKMVFLIFTFGKIINHGLRNSYEAPSLIQLSRFI